MPNNSKNETVEPKNAEATKNVIIGDSLIFVLYYTPTQNTVLSELEDHPMSARTTSFLYDLARKGVGNIPKAKYLNNPKKDIFEWKKLVHGGIRLYAHNIPCTKYDKPVYLILAVGSKNSQETDFALSDRRHSAYYAYADKKQIDIFDAIDRVIAPPQPTVPKVVARHGDYRDYAEVNRKQKHRQK